MTTPIYVICEKETYVNYSIDVITGRRYYYRVPAGTKLGWIKYEADVYRDSDKVLWKYNNETVNAYHDGYKLDLSVSPETKVKSFSVYYKNDGDTVYYSTGKVRYTYCASEFLTVSLSVAPRHSVYASSSNPYVLSDGGRIDTWGPRSTTAGTDGYAVYVGAPLSVSYEVSTSTEFCAVSDSGTNRDTGSFRIDYDYKKYDSLRYCSAKRRGIIFDQTSQVCHCIWYDTDPCYKLYPVIIYKVSLTDSKTFHVNTEATFSKTVTASYFMQ